jgi:hypothetical protein
MEGVNLVKIHCKHFCKYHNVPWTGQCILYFNVVSLSRVAVGTYRSPEAFLKSSKARIVFLF